MPVMPERGVLRQSGLMALMLVLGALLATVKQNELGENALVVEWRARVSVLERATERIAEQQASTCIQDPGCDSDYAKRVGDLRRLVDNMRLLCNRMAAGDAASAAPLVASLDGDDKEFLRIAAYLFRTYPRPSSTKPGGR